MIFFSERNGLHADEQPGTNVVDAVSFQNLTPEQDYSVFGEMFGVNMKTAYRIDLHAALVELACREEGEGETVKIVTKTGVEKFDGDRGTVTFESGEEASAELVVAADGVKSIAAAHINGVDCPPLESSDTVVFRFTLAKEDVLSDPLAQQLLDAGPGMCTFKYATNHSRLKYPR